MNELNESAHSELPYGDGSLVRAINGRQVYLVEDSALRPIRNGQVFQRHGFEFGDVKVIADMELFDLYGIGPELAD